MQWLAKVRLDWSGLKSDCCLLSETDSGIQFVLLFEDLEVNQKCLFIVDRYYVGKPRGKPNI